MGKTKTKLLTIHDLGNNFGSTLQACALANFLEDKGYQVELVDYKPAYAYHHGKISGIIKWILFPKSMFMQKKRFEAYFNSHVKRTKRYKTYGELQKDETPDIYLVGSDQVWNEFYNAGKDPAYYLAFSNCSKKMAYSTSLGQLHSDEELLRIKQKTRDFYAIGVRENASVEQLHDIGMKSVIHVLDPVFLYDKDYYVDNAFKNKYGKYVLVYSINNSPLMETVAVEIAKRKQAKIVLVGGFTQSTKHDVYLRDIGPSEFANLIFHAEYVVANSFHATAMSIIMNKQFALVMSKFSPLRLEDMLSTAGIENRMIYNEGEIEKAFEMIDYSAVNERIQRKRNESIEFLVSSMNSLSNEKVENKL